MSERAHDDNDCRSRHRSSSVASDRKSRKHKKRRSRSRRRKSDRRESERRKSDKSESKRRERRSKWDASDITFNPSQLLQMQMMAMQAQVSNKKQRELYVGNLSIGLVTADTLKEFFNGLFNVLPDYKAKYATSGSAVVHVQLSSDGKYAFVELRDEILAATCIRFNKTELCGRALNIGRPAGFNPGIPIPDPLEIAPLTSVGIVPPGGGLPPGGGGQQSLIGAGLISNKKQRDVYVGNLPPGMVTSSMLMELFSKPMTMLPEYESPLGPPVLNVELGSEGRYAFVEFQSEKLGSAALKTFQNLQLYGRSLTLGRPTGYVASDGGNSGFGFFTPDGLNDAPTLNMS
eukprot:GHVL01012114.1.p1 GENE.GHVL01012114.1~~GHVL01012114.1.p1  ORF type:complete len:346 (+),score=66.63 GHVL01012114.1:22-1059(+)